MPRVRRRVLVALGLAIALSARSQDTKQIHEAKNWRGAWIATAGQRTLRGRWWATADANSRDAASGSWTLLSDTNQILLEGAWSAKKSRQGWQGTWSARTNHGSPFSGTWTSNLPDIGAKTFEDLLTATANRQLSGSWQKGRMQGDWWLQPAY